MEDEFTGHCFPYIEITNAVKPCENTMKTSLEEHKSESNIIEFPFFGVNGFFKCKNDVLCKII